MPTVIKIRKANCLSTSKEPRAVSRLLRAVSRPFRAVSRLLRSVSKLLRNRPSAPLNYAHFQEEPVLLGVPPWLWFTGGTTEKYFSCQKLGS